MNIADDRNRPFEPDSWIPPSRMEADHVPLTEQPSNLRASWPVWAYGAVVVLVAAWVIA
jgi:hypothetical protein